MRRPRGGFGDPVIHGRKEAAAFATNEMAQSAVEHKFEISGYAIVNVSTVWNVAQNALPPLISAVQTLMDELGDT